MELRKPKEVFLYDTQVSTSRTTAEDIEKVDTSGLIDYVDFGPKANNFLKNIGVKNEPDAASLAELLLNRQANFFKNKQRSKNDLIRTYLECLERLASAIEKYDNIRDEKLIKRLQSEPWCVGFVYNDDKKNQQQTYQIALPKDIYLIDDCNIASYFRPLCPPIQGKLNQLYKRFGSKWLRDCIEINYVFQGIIYY